MSRTLLAYGRLVIAACFIGVVDAQAARVLPEPAVDVAAGGPGSVQPQPAPPRARTTGRTVFSCIEPGLVTYSDRPCGPIAVRRELKVVTPALPSGAAPDVVRPDPAAIDARRAAAAAARADAVAARAAEERATTCAKLEAAVDEVDSQMRAGYPAREAGRMWQRWREARARVREARC